MNRNDLPAPNTTCEVCGRKYRICKTCAKMRTHGIDTWRTHCDSIECYQTLIFANTTDLSTLTVDDYNRIISYELPEGRKPIEEIQNKLDTIAESLGVVKHAQILPKEEPKTEPVAPITADAEQTKPKPAKSRNKAIEYIASIKNVK